MEKIIKFKMIIKVVSMSQHMLWDLNLKTLYNNIFNLIAYALEKQHCNLQGGILMDNMFYLATLANKFVLKENSHIRQHSFQNKFG